MKSVELFTDGSCSGNPGPGGWGAIVRYGQHEKELSGGDAHTTNNRMELSAVIAGLEALKEPCAVTLTSDSKYVCDAITKGWARSWKKNGWRKSDKSPALNADLWERLLALLDADRQTRRDLRKNPAARRENLKKGLKSILIWCILNTESSTGRI